MDPPLTMASNHMTATAGGVEPGVNLLNSWQYRSANAGLITPHTVAFAGGFSIFSFPIAMPPIGRFSSNLLGAFQ